MTFGAYAASVNKTEGAASWATLRDAFVHPTNTLPLISLGVVGKTVTFSPSTTLVVGVPSEYALPFTFHATLYALADVPVRVMVLSFAPVEEIVRVAVCDPTAVGL